MKLFLVPETNLNLGGSSVTNKSSMSSRSFVNTPNKQYSKEGRSAQIRPQGDLALRLNKLRLRKEKVSSSYCICRGGGFDRNSINLDFNIANSDASE